MSARNHHDRPQVTTDLDRSARWEHLGMVVDALISSDYPGRGICHELFAAARSRLGEPLAMGAALRLSDQVKPGDPVLICSGWPSRSWLMTGLTETDGLVGAGYLARVLEQCLAAVPVLVVHPALTRFAEVALQSAGLLVADVETALQSKRGAHKASVGAILPFTSDWDDAERHAAEAFDQLEPAAVVSVEMPGALADGTFRNVTGRVVPTELVAKADVIFSEGARRGALTVGIGDGGNELGMGYIADTVRELLPDGTTPATDVDVLVVGVVSNWAAVGVGACVAAIADMPKVLRAVSLPRITERLSDAGAIDGLTAYIDPKNDGMSQATSAAFAELLTTSVEMHLDGWNKG